MYNMVSGPLYDVWNATVETSILQYKQYVLKTCNKTYNKSKTAAAKPWKCVNFGLDQDFLGSTFRYVDNKCYYTSLKPFKILPVASTPVGYIV